MKQIDLHRHIADGRGQFCFSNKFNFVVRIRSPVVVYYTTSYTSGCCRWEMRVSDEMNRVPAAAAAG